MELKLYTKQISLQSDRQNAKKRDLKKRNRHYTRSVKDTWNATHIMLRVSLPLYSPSAFSFNLSTNRYDKERYDVHTHPLLILTRQIRESAYNVLEMCTISEITNRFNWFSALLHHCQVFAEILHLCRTFALCIKLPLRIVSLFSTVLASIHFHDNCFSEFQNELTNFVSPNDFGRYENYIVFSTKIAVYVMQQDTSRR